jgi:UDP-3-O-[3-hydroxymyristoyl] N-acetylglucosamine deacetylase
VGLHSGAPVTMRLLPAPAGSGIVFRRTDLDNFEIPAIGRNVAKVSYATSLMRQGVLISTTEHLLSALIGMGVDNVIVEIDNLELPILDGSARPYVEAFLAAGIKVQRRRREYIRVLRPVEVREGDKFIGVYPGDGYSITYEIDFPAPIGHDSFSVDLETETYGAEIAAARTFGYKADEQKLRNMGLIRGAGPENAIILTPRGPENGPLRFGRVCSPQGAGPDRRPGTGGQADSGQGCCRARGTCDAYGAGFAADQGPLGLGSGLCAGGQGS